MVRKLLMVMVVAAMIIAIVVPGCTPPTTYNLTMAADPAVGGTATDEVNTSPYAAGTVVNITAVAAPCYRFVNWTAPAGTFANANAAGTTFTMPAQNVTVTAHFELTPPNHFKFYGVDEAMAGYVGKDVQLVDQFGAIDATVGWPLFFGNPVEKVHGDVVTPIGDKDHHLTFYTLEYEGEPQSWQVMVNNQFQDDQWLTVFGPVALAVPTQKGDHEAPVCLDHFLVYAVVYEPFPEVGVFLSDQFTGEDVVVWEPLYFANPVTKEHDGVVTDIKNPDEHLVFYRIEGESFSTTVQTANQFGEWTLGLTDPELLAVPSQKISWDQPLDHFKCYSAEGMPLGADVLLEDQFVTIEAHVTAPYFFANPVQKWHGEAWTPISNPDNHLTFYEIFYDGMPGTWYVEVDNQFGSQMLLVGGPFYLAVPTQKEGHDPPVDLDHFLVYEVLEYEGPDLDVELWLEDQFTDQPAMAYWPAYFANPVRKEHATAVSDIKNPDDHLVFYWIDGGLFGTELSIHNQFGPQEIFVYQAMMYDFLGLPSVKVFWEPAG